MRLNQLLKHFCDSDWCISKTCILNASTAFWGVEKCWPFILFFTYGNKKKSFGAKSGQYGGWLIKSMFWVLKNAVVWADVWELALSWWSWRLVFLISWKTVLRYSSGTIATSPVFPKKQAINCLKCFVREQLLLAHFETPIQSTAIYFWAQTRKFTIHHISRRHRRTSKHRDRIFGAFLSTNRQESFFNDWQILCDRMRTKFFLTVKCSCNIESMLVPLMLMVVSISR